MDSTDPNTVSVLPACFERPSAQGARQANLFKTRFADAIAGLQVSLDELARWHSSGWLSFDGKGLEVVDAFDDPRIWEVIVIRDLARSGLNDAQVKRLIDELPRPAAIDPALLAYSFQHGWVVAIPPRDPDPNEIIEEHFSEWMESLDDERLVELRLRIDARVAALRDEK
jgi:hypothetical protein